MTGSVIRMSVRSRRSRTRKGTLPALPALRGTRAFVTAAATAAAGSSTAAGGRVPSGLLPAVMDISWRCRSCR